jgi:hypothetical protein
MSVDVAPLLFEFFKELNGTLPGKLASIIVALTCSIPFFKFGLPPITELLVRLIGAFRK